MQMSQAATSGLVNEVQSARKEPRVVHQRINRVAVLGAGSMGARIAAHLANAGTPCYLLDIVPPDADESTDRAARTKIVPAGLHAAANAKPPPVFQQVL